MKVKVNSVIFRNNNKFKKYKDSLYSSWIEILEANEEEEFVNIDADEIIQDDLDIILSEPSTKLSGFHFYAEIDSELLELDTPLAFPNSKVLIDEVEEQKLLKDYIFGNMKIKNDKALIKIDYCTLANRSKIDHNNLTHEFLELFLNEYANNQLTNIFTSKDAIAEKKAEYEVV